MRLLLIFLSLALTLSVAGAQLDRGVKGDVEDAVLLGADDWHSTVAATPLAIWSEGNETVVKPMLILPKSVSAGDRVAWIEQSDLDRYGVLPVLHTMTQAGISSVIIHGSGDLVKSMVEAAKKEGIKAYVTVGLEPEYSESKALDIDDITSSSDPTLPSAARDMFLSELDLDDAQAKVETADEELMQRPISGVEANSSLLCPVNPDAKEKVYDQIERLIDDYKVDGVVLYSFGFENDNYCFCDYCKEEFYKDTGIDLTKVYSSNYNTSAGSSGRKSRPWR